MWLTSIGVTRGATIFQTIASENRWQDLRIKTEKQHRESCLQ